MIENAAEAKVPSMYGVVCWFYFPGVSYVTDGIICGFSLLFWLTCEIYFSKGLCPMVE